MKEKHAHQKIMEKQSSQCKIISGICDTQNKFLHTYSHCQHQPGFLISLCEPETGELAVVNIVGGAERTEILTLLQNEMCVNRCLCNSHLLCNIILSLQTN